MLTQSESRPDASVEIINERQLSPDMADSSSFDDTTSSSDTGGYNISIPLLLSIESPLLSAVITVLNSTDLGRSILSNNGVDVVDHIDYDSEWWRHMPEASKRDEKTQAEWENSVRVDLQILSAFLGGHMKRKLAATGNLESLFRMKKDREEEPRLLVPSIFKILAQLPEFEKALVSKVKVDGDTALVLPVPVSTNRHVKIQRALDETFWAPSLETENSSGVKVPYLERLTDIFVVYCLEKGIEIVDQIKPERYGIGSASQIEKRLSSMKELSLRQNEIQETLRKLSVINGKPVVESLELAAAAMREAGNMAASEELLTVSAQSKEKIASLQAEADSLLSQLEISIENLLDPSQEATMTPYFIKALLWPESSSEGPALIHRSGSSDVWHYICGSTYYKITWLDVVKYAINNESYLAIYERKNDHTSDISLAPSVQRFVDQDNEVFLETVDQDEDEDDVRDEDDSDSAKRVYPSWVDSDDEDVRYEDASVGDLKGVEPVPTDEDEGSRNEPIEKAHYTNASSGSHGRDPATAHP